MAASTPSVRVSPSPGPPLSARVVARLAGLATGNEPLRLFTTVGRHRRLSRYWLPFAGVLLLRGRLPRSDTELLVLRTAWNCDGWYEWVQHVSLAARAGLRLTQIQATAAGPSAAGWTPRQKVLLEAADELHAACAISDATWERLSEQLTTQERIEVCFVVGHYQMLAMALNSLGVEPEPTALAQLDATSAALASRLPERLLSARAGQCPTTQTT